MRPLSSVFSGFFSANAAILALFLGALGLGTGVQDMMLGHPYLAGALLGFIELVVILSLIFIHRDHPTTPRLDNYDDDSISVVALHGRFAEVQDLPDVDQVYHEWFKPELEIAGEESCALLERGEFMRVIEAEHIKSSKTQIRIAGYYTLLPISLDTFGKLSNGVLLERNLKSTMVLSPSDQQASVLYIMEVCTSKHEWSVVRSSLMMDLACYIGYLLNTHKQLEYVATWPYTEFGFHYVKKFQMKKYGKSILKKFYAVKRDIVLSQPITRKRFNSQWTVKF